MYCPKCKSENSDSAKFCKKCGTPLKSREISHKNMINSMSNESSGTDKTKIIIIALIVVAVVLAGAFIYLNTMSNNNSAGDEVETVDNEVSESPVQATQTSQSAPKAQMTIKGGSFSTGSGLSDKTYAKIYVGEEFSGENVIIQIFYSRDGSDLNNGNMVSKTVDSSGYIEVASAEPYSLYPDFASVNLYDSSSNLLDSRSVSLSATSGTQTF